MGIAELFLIGVGLSMDAFAVALCKGLCMRRIEVGQMMVIALFFGGFQALMPFLGWVIGKQFEGYIVNIDHWVAFGLLLLIGGKMLWEAVRGGDEPASDRCGPLDLKELFVMAVATSIDAFAVGISFSLLSVNIFSSITVIGITTFGLSAVGVLIGHRFGSKFEKKAEFAGGLILILIGAKILFEHLGFIHF